MIFEGGGGGWKIQTVQEFFFRPREQDRYFFPVKVQRKIFFSQYISRQDIFFASHNLTAYSNLRLSYSYRQRRSRGFQSEEAARTESQEGPRNFHCALFYVVMS